MYIAFYRLQLQFNDCDDAPTQIIRSLFCYLPLAFALLLSCLLSFSLPEPMQRARSLPQYIDSIILHAFTYTQLVYAFMDAVLSWASFVLLYIRFLNDSPDSFVFYIQTTTTAFTFFFLQFVQIEFSSVVRAKFLRTEFTRRFSEPKHFC